MNNQFDELTKSLAQSVTRRAPRSLEIQTISATQRHLARAAASE